ncbi:NnrS family protein [Azohydromonas sediminis]|uniref:NnrS family protein n=1 Tax=Azohydromonas sediminis TaxID=2259674 RepID=UPI000E6570EC|nr:NnrS family protein [Azohydromonas sediminis]
MTPLLRIEEPGSGVAPPASLRAWLALGFRPLYLLGTAWAAIAVALWTFAPQWLPGTMGGLAWHAHEMLWGFVATIAVGFLMTAGANWTAINPLPRPWLALAVALWVTARIALLVDHPAAFDVGALAEVAFFALAAAALGRAVIRARNTRNAGLPPLLLALAGADAAFLWHVRAGDVAAALGWVQAGLVAMALVALLIARRVTPFFAMRAVPGLQIPLHQRSGQVQLAAVGVGVVAVVAGWREPAAAAMALAGAIALWQVASWKPAAVLARPILWILYLGHAGVGAGLLVAAAHLAGAIGAPAAHVHVIALLGFAVLIVGMVTRTALGHLGRALALDRSMVASYALVVAAAVLRLAALAATPLAPWLLKASALAWVAAFALYLWRFTPWLVRPRADGRPG